MYHVGSGSDSVNAGAENNSVLDGIRENTDSPASPQESLTSQELRDFEKEMEAYKEEYASKPAQGEPENPPSPYDSMEDDYTVQDDMDTGDSSEV